MAESTAARDEHTFSHAMFHNPVTKVMRFDENNLF